MSVTQGKCTTCRLRLTWPAGKPKLRDAYCSKCGTKLERTSSQLDWPGVVCQPVTANHPTARAWRNAQVAQVVRGMAARRRA